MKTIESLVRAFVADIQAATRAELLASLGAAPVVAPKPVLAAVKAIPKAHPRIATRKRKVYRSGEQMAGLIDRAVAIVWANSGLSRSEVAKRLGITPLQAQRPLRLAVLSGKIAAAGARSKGQYFGTRAEADRADSDQAAQ